MSKIELIGYKIGLPVSGGFIAWPHLVPSPDVYATILNLYVIPTLGAITAFIVLLINARKWWRGSRWSGSPRDESGVRGNQSLK
jgi:hypothetical protein